jgi:NADH-quinone oxidoreductase subunit M
MQLVLANLLTLIVFTPLVGSAVLMLLPRGNKSLIRWLALIFSLIPLVLAVVLWLGYDAAQPGFQFEEQVPWFPQIGSTYHLGVDGISVSMILLTALLAPLAILISWSIEERVNLYMALFLMLEMGMLGVFAALDLVIFFIFWEIGLVPMYFLINIWGSDNRRYASFKFFIYTMAGSVGLLLAIQLIGLTMGTFDIVALIERWPAFSDKVLGVPIGLVKMIGFWLFTLAFAIKVPIWPFHTWLPDAHTEAPTAGSMILAGVLLKLGAYGFLRLVLPLFPQEAAIAAPVLAALAMLAIVFGAFAAFGQDDFKRLVAYSSVNHMGFVVLAIAVAGFVGAGGMHRPDHAQDAIIAANGAVLQMFNHGLSSAAMFLLVGVVYERTHTRDLRRFGGLWTVAPVYGGILMFSSMASLGLPGLSGFVSEFLVVRGSWPVFTLMTAISMLGLLFTGAYILKGIRDVLHGPLNQEAVELAHGRPLEINRREIIAVAPLLVLMLLIGVFPAWILDVINATIVRLLG